MENEKLALVVEGGAMRGIFSTGVLDAFIERDYYPFELCVGVSAGATNIASYLARMERRNYIVYTKYSTSRKFINPLNYFKGGHILDLDWLWDICIKEIRLDIEAVISSSGQYLVGVTDATSGKTEYIEPTRENLEDLVKATSAVPVLYRHPIKVNGKYYWDGGVSDPIPVKEAINRGGTTLVVLRSRKQDFRMKENKFSFPNLLISKYPNVAKVIRNRPKVYNRSLDLLREGFPGVNIIEVCPDEDFKTSRLTTDLNILEKDYQMGLKTGRNLVEHLIHLEFK